MLEIKLYNQEGQEMGKQKLNPKIFAVEANEDLVHQAVVAQMANRRKILAHVKDRSEVRGGGRKPWRQKGTGRARHGSIRSPLWVGGGATFAPTKERNFSKKINKKMKRKALFIALSDKAKDKKIVVLDKLDIPEAKTKILKDILDKLSLEKKTLIILDRKDDKIRKSVGNLKNFKMLRADSLNVVDVLSHNNLLITADALKNIEKTFKI